MTLANIPPPPFSGIELGPLDLRMYGLVIAVGAFIGLTLAVRRFERMGGQPEIAEKAALVALAGGFLGARIGYVIPRFLGEGGFIERPFDILAIWQGGLAFFGGLVLGTILVILYTRSQKADFPSMADALVPALPLAQAFGRWGNYFNQELYGRPTDLPWALEVEPGFRRAPYQDEATFHPTFLYESLWNLGLVWLLLTLDKRGVLRRRGSLLFVYLIGYGVGRGWIETLRIDTVERYFGLSRNNWIAILIVVIGIVGLRWWETRGTGALLRDGAGRDGTGHDGVDDVDDEAPASGAPAGGAPAGEKTTGGATATGETTIGGATAGGATTDGATAGETTTGGATAGGASASQPSGDDSSGGASSPDEADDAPHPGDDNDEGDAKR